MNTEESGQVVDLYARISDDQTGDAMGTDNQLAALREWVTGKGWTVGTEYRDDDVSAFTGKKRPDFERLLARAVQRPVAVFETERLYRTLRDVERIIDAGFQVHAMTAGGLDLTTPGGRFQARILASHGTYELEQKRERARLRNSADAAKGLPYWRRRPFGWELDGTLRQEEAEAIRWAVDEFMVGNSLAAICREFNARGLTTPVSKAGGVGGNAWQTVNLRQLLTNQRLAGLRTYEGTTVRGSWEPILTEDEWRGVVAILRDPSRLKNTSKTGRTPSTLLTGIATCPVCGLTVQGMGPSYRCPTTHFYRKRAGVDVQVRNRTLGLLLTEGAERILTENDGPETADMRKRATELRTYLRELEDASQDIGVAAYLRMSRKAETELQVLEQAMADADRMELFAGITADVKDWEAAAERWSNLPLARRRGIVRTLWDSVEFEPGKNAGMILEPSSHARRVMAKAGGVSVVIPGADGVWSA